MRGPRGKGPITFVMGLGAAESYRFFFGSGTDLRYELPPFSAVDQDDIALDEFARGNGRGVRADFGGKRLGGWRGVVGASG
jgi:hypothetical protein